MRLMLYLEFLAVMGAIALIVSSFREKPNETDPDIWDADPVKRAENLKAAMVEYKAGRRQPHSTGLVALPRTRSALERFTGRDYRS